jgi:nucleoside-diphosphate-sugar epimerase
MYAAAVPIFIRRLLDNKPITIYGDGGQSRDLVNVRDVVQANLLASQHSAAPGQIFNVCTGVETRLLDLLDILYGIFPDAPMHIHAEPRAGDIYRSIGTPTKAMETLGFKPQVTLAEGVKEAVEEMRNQ